MRLLYCSSGHRSCAQFNTTAFTLDTNKQVELVLHSAVKKRTPNYIFDPGVRYKVTYVVGEEQEEKTQVFVFQVILAALRGRTH